jgi:hypothetical protein
MAASVMTRPRGIGGEAPLVSRPHETGDLPGVSSHLQRHPVAGRQALGEQLQILPGAAHPATRAAAARIDDRHLAEIAMDV